MTTKEKYFGFKIEEKDFFKLKELAHKKNISIAQVCREAIKEKLEK